VEDGRLGLRDEGLLENGERARDLRLRLLTIERCSILEYLGGDERVRVGEVPGDVEADDAIQCATGGDDLLECSLHLLGLSGWHCTLKGATIIGLPPGFAMAD
jgi:hypothetical protein